MQIDLATLALLPDDAEVMVYTRTTAGDLRRAAESAAAPQPAPMPAGIEEDLGAAEVARMRGVSASTARVAIAAIPGAYKDAHGRWRVSAADYRAHQVRERAAGGGESRPEEAEPEPRQPARVPRGKGAGWREVFGSSGTRGRSAGGRQ
jgi:hypothetical protein